MRQFILFIAFSAAAYGQCGTAGQLIWNGVTNQLDCTAVVGAGTGSVTSVGLVGTANQITVTGSSPITSSGSWTISFPAGGVTLPGTTTGTFTGNLTGNASGTAATITGALALANTPLTTKGDLLGVSTVLGRLPVGTDGQVLTADAASTLGIKWAASAGAPAFSAVTAGTNTAALVMGTGGSLTVSGTGTINATNVNGVSLAGLATGPLKNTTTTGVPSIAVAADIIGLWSGTCNASSVLAGDGSCAAISSAYTAITGVPANSLLGNNTGSTANAISLTALPFTVSVATGGTGTASTLTGLVRGSATAMTAAELSGDATTSGSNVVTVAKVNGIAYSATAAAHTVQVTTTANTTATAKAIPDCTDTGGNHLNFTQSTDAFSCGTSGGSAGANTALSNLASVSINSVLKFQTGIAVGDTTNPAKNIVFNLSGTYGTGSYTFAGTPTANRTITMPVDADFTIARQDAAQTFTGVQTFVAPILGTPTSATLTNATGLPAAGVVGTAAVLNGNNVFTANGGLSSGVGPGLTQNGTWVTGGSATTTKPYVLIEPTGTTSTGWSTSGTGLGVNAASGFTGNLTDLQLAGTSVFKVSSAGAITTTGTLLSVGGTNIYNNGVFTAPGTGQYQASSTGAFYFNTRTVMESGANGDLTLWNFTRADFGLLHLGGTTSSFPALKRSGATLAFRLSDDSADTSITASTATFTNVAASGAGAAYLCIESNVLKTGATCAVSTERAKTNIADFQHGLDWLSRFRPVSFNMKRDGISTAGFIAEDMDRISPLLSIRSEGQVYSIQDRAVLAVVVKSIQELSEKVRALEEK